jgi:hypothetical protein
VLRLAHEAVAQLARGQELAAALVLDAGERRIVDLEGHRDRRFVHRQHRQLFHFGGVADRVGNAEAFDARDGDDVAGPRFLDLMPFEAEEAKHLQHLGVAGLAFAVDHRDLLVGLDRAALDAADADDADVVAVVERGHAHLERTVEIDRRRRDMVDDGLE